MRRFLREELSEHVRLYGAREGLFEALRIGGHFNLDYDASTTRTASQAFAARSGNCLSLVLLTAALAKELGLGVSYQSVRINEVWTRSNSLVLQTGHINISLSPSPRDPSYESRLLGPMTIDFVPIDDSSRLRAVSLSEDQVVSQFWNNRAVEALDKGELQHAQSLVYAAIEADPNSMNAFNTLGVVYRRCDEGVLAEHAFTWALELDPKHIAALTNLSQLLKEQGRHEAAQIVEARLQRLQPRSPFEAFERGLSLARRGQWREALAAFGQEEAQGTVFHDLYYWLARCHFEIGDKTQSLRYLERARNEALTQEQRQRYSLKLEVLRKPAPKMLP